MSAAEHGRRMAAKQTGLARMRRLANFKLVISTFQHRPFSNMSVMDLLGVSEANARLYYAKLCEAGICENINPTKPGSNVVKLFKITGTPQVISEFFAALEKSIEGFTAEAMAQVAANNGLLPGTLVHQLEDDYMARIGNSDVVVRRDPLVSALFGEAA